MLELNSNILFSGIIKFYLRSNVNEFCKNFILWKLFWFWPFCTFGARANTYFFKFETLLCTLGFMREGLVMMSSISSLTKVCPQRHCLGGWVPFAWFKTAVEYTLGALIASWTFIYWAAFPPETTLWGPIIQAITFHKEMWMTPWRYTMRVW